MNFIPLSEPSTTPKTIRTTYRVPDRPDKTPVPGAGVPITGHDSSGLPDVATRGRVGRSQLKQLGAQLTPPQVRVLGLVAQFRFASSRHVARATSDGYASSRSAMRQTNRALAALESLDLVRPLPRAVGGMGGGSRIGIWTITEPGQRLVDTATQTVDVRGRGRVRTRLPSPAFVTHYLAVTELHVQLIELQHAGEVERVAAQTEPACWRKHLTAQGVPAWLKPDLAIEVVTTDGFEDRWFVEADLATESPSRVLRKCHQYQWHQLGNTEQTEHGVYPAVLWVVPTAHRLEQLTRHLAADTTLTPGLFHVTTFDAFSPRIGQGPTLTAAQ